VGLNKEKENREECFGFSFPPMGIDLTLDCAAKFLARMRKEQKQRIKRGEEKGRSPSSGENPKANE